MGAFFWIRRFFLALVVAFAVIATSHLVRGRGLNHAVTEAAIWSVLSAAVFTVGRYFQARRGQHCAICRDTPEMQALATRRARARPHASINSAKPSGAQRTDKLPDVPPSEMP
jgi:hypothetical protein